MKSYKNFKTETVGIPEFCDIISYSLYINHV